MAVSRQRVKTTDLYKSVGMILDEYAAGVEKGVDREAAKASKTLVDDLKRDSPNRTGEYSRSWGRIRQGGVYIVRNVKHWRLTHLLENGHQKRGGKGIAKAFPHILKNAEKAVKEFDDAVESMIRKGPS